MVTLTFTLLGLLLGSFANVVIHRLPLGGSVARPRSACPTCAHTLSALELLPVLSYLALRGRCRSCSAPISPRYPLVELANAGGYAWIAFTWNPLTTPVTALAVAAWWTTLLVVAFIDLEHYQIPDVLTLPLLGMLLALAPVWATSARLPSASDALAGAIAGAGLLVLINRVGGWVLRGFRDTQERLWPIGFDAVNVAALAGAIAGVRAGAVAAIVHVGVNLAARRTVRLPEPPVYALWLAALMAAPLGIGFARAATGSVLAAGGTALVGAVVWWIVDLRASRRAADRVEFDGGGPSAGDVAASDPLDPAANEPVAMGFGDVKLAALLGVMLGWQMLLVVLFLAVLLGAIVGVFVRLRGGARVVPFGPFLVVAAVVGLTTGDLLLDAYLRLLGFT